MNPWLDLFLWGLGWFIGIGLAVLIPSFIWAKIIDKIS
jgi:hypothetical protein